MTRSVVAFVAMLVVFAAATTGFAASGSLLGDEEGLTIGFSATGDAEGFVVIDDDADDDGLQTAGRDVGPTSLRGEPFPTIDAVPNESDEPVIEQDVPVNETDAPIPPEQTGNVTGETASKVTDDPETNVSADPDAHITDSTASNVGSDPETNSTSDEAAPTGDDAPGTTNVTEQPVVTNETSESASTDASVSSAVDGTNSTIDGGSNSTDAGDTTTTDAETTDSTVTDDPIPPDDGDGSTTTGDGTA
jgi:hypothetical protein